MNFSNLIYFFISPILFGCSMYGWGNVFFFNALSKYISVNIVIGMGITLFFGGILNVFNLAYQSTIDIIFLFGLVLFIVKIYKSRNYFHLPKLINKENKSYFLTLLPITLLIISIISSINPDSYNYHDDYQKYFVHPVKMLETGSVFGSTLSAIGRETFGGQAFFQSFYKSWLGLKAINIFDSVFCLSVCILLILEQGIKQRTPIFGILVSCLLILIHPQVVNISSLYSGILFMSISIVLMLELFRDRPALNFSLIKIILGISFCFASLISLKTTFGLFSGVFYTLILIFICVSRTFTKNFLYFIFVSPFLSLMFAAPWMFFSLQHYALKQSTNKPLEFDVEVHQSYFPSLFSIDSLFYGGSQLHYTMLTFIGIFLIILSIYSFKKQNFDFQKVTKVSLLIGTTSVISGFIIYLFLILLLNPIYHAISTSTRYSIPFLVATIPLGILILYSLFTFDLRYLRFIVCTVIITFSLTFFPQYVKRITQSYECGSQLSFVSFACSENYINYNKDIFNDEKKLMTQKWQENIPKKVPVMAWINTPFFLNYKRNEIIEIDIAGLDNPWAIFPSAEYMIWERKGFATRSLKDLQHKAKTAPLYDRKVAIRTIQHIKKIRDLYNAGKIRFIKDDGEVLIFKILK